MLTPANLTYLNTHQLSYKALLSGSHATQTCATAAPQSDGGAALAAQSFARVCAEPTSLPVLDAADIEFGETLKGGVSSLVVAATRRGAPLAVKLIELASGAASSNDAVRHSANRTLGGLKVNGARRVKLNGVHDRAAAARTADPVLRATPQWRRLNARCAC